MSALHRSQRVLSLHDSLLSRAEQLPRLSTTVLDLVAAVGDPDSDVDMVAAVVGRDPSLVADLLHEANSALHANGNSIGSIEQAIMRLGTSRVVTIAVSNNLGTGLRDPLMAYGISGETFYQQAYIGAKAAEICCHLAKPSLAREYTVAALLRDFGRVVIEPLLEPELAARLLAVDPSGLLMETELLETDHAEVSAHLLWSWRLPTIIVDAVRLHHRPADHSGACVVYVADEVALHILDEEHRPSDPGQLASSLAVLGLDDKFDQIVAKVLSRLD